MTRLRSFEQRLDRKLREILGGNSPATHRQIVEIDRAILDDIASHVTVLPRGKRAFSYSDLQIRIFVPEPALIPSYKAAFLDADFEESVRTRLREERTDMPKRFSIRVELVGELPEARKREGFVIEYGMTTELTAPATCKLTIVRGAAEQTLHEFAAARVNLGRMAEVLDQDHILVRTNHIAFSDDGSNVNQSVSRQHAHLWFDAESGGYRISDDRSKTGTSVIRSGESIRVPSGTAKGILLQSGDEIRLGEARIKFEQSNS